VEIVRRLAEERVGEILAVEPHIPALPPELAEHGLALHDFDRAVERANLVLLLVDHMSFLSADRDRLKDKLVIDTRGVW
jgi:UDP-N-acetyl-D-mannosaminuronic acid dehydrogenase